MSDSPSSIYSQAYHAAHLTREPSRTVVWRVLASHLARFIPPQSHVLEIGAGYCDWINQTRAARKVAVDLWREFPRHAAPDVLPLILDVGSGLPSLGVGRFDAVLASNLLEHFDPDRAAQVAADVAALLRPGGRFIIVQPNFRHAYRSYFDDYTHRAVFTDVSLPNLLRAQGLRIEELRPRFMPYSMRESRLPIKPWLIEAYLRSPLKPLAGQMLVVAQKV